MTKRDSSDSERGDDIWWRVAEGIKPLKSRRRAVPLSLPDPASPAPAVKRCAPLPAKAQPPAKPPLPELTPGVARGVDKRTAQRLGRGLLQIEARLDLHGLTQEEAHARLARFLDHSVAAGHRCVLVITGKGYKPTGDVGVLRRSVPRWLNEPDLRRHVVALRHAQPKDGGEGALYLLLKRNRGERPAGKDAPPPKRLTRIRRS